MCSLAESMVNATVMQHRGMPYLHHAEVRNLDWDLGIGYLPECPMSH